MSRNVITNDEMERRAEMARAQASITHAMAEHRLTALEWANVLNECARRMIGHGLCEEWGVDEP